MNDLVAKISDQQTRNFILNDKWLYVGKMNSYQLFIIVDNYLLITSFYTYKNSILIILYLTYMCRQTVS